eukprot:TRINITY_DN4274_c0_g7_i1.p1 TRINITY_DN4274_c0_g7~~TRINITY_DN4274_c0_g7_i1.p1  ORF type:complete len:245 (+),score=27.18 TRINITY_DN4274_c0_g7_i1:71-805(+)
MDPQSPLYRFASHQADDWESVSSTGVWGHPDLVNGDQLFEAMGEAYAAKRLKELEGERRFRAPAPQQLYHQQRQQQPPPPPRDRYQSKPAQAYHQRPPLEVEDRDWKRHAPVSAPAVPPPPSPIAPIEVPTESVSGLADSILHDSSSGLGDSIDGELYTKLSPHGTLIRGATLPPGVHAATGGDVDSFRVQLRQEFWKEFMQSYDRRCAATYVSKNKKGGDRNKGTGKPSPRIPDPRKIPRPIR